MKRLFFNRACDWRWLRLMMLVATLTISACSDSEDEVETDTTYQDLEQELFDKYMAWLNTNKELGLTLSDDATYYYKIDANGGGGTTTNGDECWVRYDITSRNLTGDSYECVNLTTYEDIALNQQSFSYYTHYVPTLHELDEADSDYDSALDLILRANATYAGDYITIYAPSSLSYGLVNGSGYGGSATLSAGESFYSNIEIKEVIRDIETWEQNVIDEFVADAGILTNKATDLDDSTSEIEIYYYSSDNPNDVDLDFLDVLPITYPYSYLTLRRGIDDINAKVKSLLQTFTEGEIEDAIEDGAETESDDATKLVDITNKGVIGSTDDAKIWYIGRMLDGFIFDSNIDSIKGLMLNDYDTNSALTYNATDDGDTYIEGFYHMIPKLKYGTWNVVLISSTYAYSTSGLTGSTTNVNIKPYTPIIFYIYIEPETT
ncbi:MAG: hypothetical protein SNG35_02880 [Rikenellaceae bacterium]